MEVAMLVLALLILLTVAGHAYLSGRERRGLAAEFDRLRAVHATEERVLRDKLGVLDTENDLLVRERDDLRVVVDSLTAEATAQRKRAESAESVLHSR